MVFIYGSYIAPVPQFIPIGTNTIASIYPDLRSRWPKAKAAWHNFNEGLSPQVGTVEWARLQLHAWSESRQTTEKMSDSLLTAGSLLCPKICHDYGNSHYDQALNSTSSKPRQR